MSNRNPRQLALAYLGAHQVMTLATCAQGKAWAAAVFYARQEFDLFFLSAPHTLHVRHFAENPTIAAAIHEDYAGWEEIRGIQLEGTVTQLDGVAAQEAQALYMRRFTFLAHAPEELDQALAAVKWYRLRPHLLYFIDNSEGLGHRDRIL